MTLRSAWTYFFGRRKLRAQPPRREQIITPATLLTLGRAAISTAILVVAIIDGSYGLLLAGLAFSMFFDFVDGQIARGLRDETVLGAQLDGIADRIAAALVAAGMVSMHSSAAVVIAATAVWIQFGVVDQFLTSQFLRFGLWSPDHFYQLPEPWGERIWRQNWSAIAKLASNLPIVLLALQAWWLALAAALALIFLRVPGYLGIRALARELSTPTPAGLDSPAPSPLTRRVRRAHPDPHRAQRVL